MGNDYDGVGFGGNERSREYGCWRWCGSTRQRIGDHPAMMISVDRLGDWSWSSAMHRSSRCSDWQPWLVRYGPT